MFTRFHCHPSDTPPQCPAHVFTVIPLTPHHNAQYGLTNIPPMVRCIEQIFAHQYALLTLYYNPYTPITPICPTLHTPHLLQYALLTLNYTPYTPHTSICPTYTLLHSVHPTYFNMPYTLYTPLTSTCPTYNLLHSVHPTPPRCAVHAPQQKSPPHGQCR